MKDLALHLWCRPSLLLLAAQHDPDLPAEGCEQFSSCLRLRNNQTVFMFAAWWWTDSPVHTVDTCSKF